MPALRLYRHGLTAFMPSFMSNPNPEKRGKVKGWSAKAAQRNANFLRSVDETKLSGIGYAVTLTVRECPPSPKDWNAAVRAWMERQRRAGMKRLHWVMEFQKRGVPHLHAAIWFRENVAGALAHVSMLEDWLQIAGDRYGASEKGQHARLITGTVGWFEYMAKHCSRSRKHYQRQREAVPEAWESSPRVWGHRGEWDLVDPTDERLTHPEYWRFRRLVKRARVAEARAGLPLNRRQFGQAKRLLKTPDRKLSEVRGVSEWMSQERQRQFIAAAKEGRSMGEPVTPHALVTA